MYVTAKGVELKTTNSGAQSVSGAAGGVRTGSSGADIINSLKADTLMGGLGDDAYNLWDAASKVVEKAGQGVDTVYVKYYAGYQLPDNVENAFLQTTYGNWATGNALNNVLVAGPVHATLDGGAGDDVLVGGAGADVFKVTAGNGSDAIYNFRPGWDAVQLTGYGISSFEQLKANAIQTGSDVTLNLSGSETLVLRDVKLDTLTAVDFGLPTTKPAGFAALSADTKHYSSGKAYNANGWYFVNNAWGTSGLTEGKDFTLDGSFKTTDMVKGTTFNWSFALTTDVIPSVKAFPEVIFGISPLNSVRYNPTDTKMVLPVKVADLVGLTATYDVSYSGNTGGFNVAYDIWMTNKAYGDKSTLTNEIMVWVHKGDFPAWGTLVGTYSDGDFVAKIYHSGTYTALVAEHDVPKGALDIADILKTLQTLGIVSPNEYVASIELGAEVTSGAGSLTINDLNLQVASVNGSGGATVKTVTGAGTTVLETTKADAQAIIDHTLATHAATSHPDLAVVSEESWLDPSGAYNVALYGANHTLLAIDSMTTADGIAKILNYDAAVQLQGVEYRGSTAGDVLQGEAVKTQFHGGLGSDTLTGGYAVDYFHFDTAIGQGDVDTIAGFQPGQDKLVLHTSVFTQLSNGALDASAFVAGTKARDANDRILFDKATGHVWYDDDGTGAHTPILFATVSGDLHATDFLVI